MFSVEIHWPFKSIEHSSKHTGKGSLQTHPLDESKNAGWGVKWSIGDFNGFLRAKIRTQRLNLLLECFLRSSTTPLTSKAMWFWLNTAKCSKCARLWKPLSVDLWSSFAVAACLSRHAQHTLQQVQTSARSGNARCAVKVEHWRLQRVPENGNPNSQDLNLLLGCVRSSKSPQKTRRTL